MRSGKVFSSFSQNSTRNDDDAIEDVIDYFYANASFLCFWVGLRSS